MSRASRTSEEPPHIALRRAAMDFLARREHSWHELLVKLGDRFPDCDRHADIEPVLERLREEKLQSDERFTEAYVRHRRNAGHGPIKIRLELQRKGVAASLIEACLYDDDHDWRELAREALARRHGAADLREPREYQRCYRFLAQRGFESEDISAALSAIKATGPL